MYRAAAAARQRHPAHALRLLQRDVPARPVGVLAAATPAKGAAVAAHREHGNDASTRASLTRGNRLGAAAAAASPVTPSSASSVAKTGEHTEVDKGAVPQHPAYEVVRASRIPEHSALAVLYRHTGSGAQLLSVQCEEEEKVFGVAFKTPVADDTGVPHILEHSVLCGSRKYPVKEPFVELLKSSLQTYLNAMTYADRTVYPVASPNLRDFYHLVDVYLDAVFNPRLDPWVLQQEGWHYELTPRHAAAAAASAAGGSSGLPAAEAAAAAHAAAARSGHDLAPSGVYSTHDLTLKGVVLNEMKGVYSSPDSIRHYATEAALWPDNAYRHSSGGDPAAIPTLSYEAFLAYHRRHYAPRNARAFFFGDDAPARRLEIMAEYLGSSASINSSGVGSSVGSAAGSGKGATLYIGAAGRRAGTEQGPALAAAPAASAVDPSPAAASVPVAATATAAAPADHAWPVDEFTVSPQALWSAPRRISAPYPSAGGAGGEGVEGGEGGEFEEGMEGMEGAEESLLEGAGEGPAGAPAADVSQELGLAPPAPIAVPEAAAAAAELEGAGALAGSSDAAAAAAPTAAVASFSPAGLVDESASAAGPVEAAPAAAAPAAATGEDASAAASAHAAPDRHDVTVNWVLHDTPLDEVTRMGLAVLGQLLMRTQVATLYKALTDSALGSSVIGGGYDDGQLQATFAAGLKGVKAADVERVEPLILATLARVAGLPAPPIPATSADEHGAFTGLEGAAGSAAANSAGTAAHPAGAAPTATAASAAPAPADAAGGDSDGFSPEHVASTLNSIEFSLREFSSGGGPRGLSLFLGAVPGWIYGRDPIDELRFEGPLRRLKAAIAADPRYFQGLIATYLLRNPHRLTAHMYPDPALSSAREAAERTRLADAFGRMSAVEVQGVSATQAELLRRQQTPDDPAEVAKIPTLQLADLPEHSKAIGREVRAVPLQGVAPLCEEIVAAAEAAAEAAAAAAAAQAAAGAAGVPAAASPSVGVPSSNAASPSTQGMAAAAANAAPAAFADGTSPAAYNGHSTAGSGTSLRAEINVRVPGSGGVGGASPAASADSATTATTADAGATAAAAAASTSTFTSLVHEQPTSGIAYASLHFDLSVLPQPLLPYLPLFSWALTSTGTARTDEVAMSHLLGTHTGGVGVGPSALEVPGHREAALPFLVVSSKCLAEKSHRAAALVHDLLTGANLHRRDRVTHYLRTSIAGYESSLVSSGHRFASQLLAAQYSKPGWIGEVLGGLTQLEACRAMLQRIESGAEGGFDRIAGDLESIRRAVLTRGNVLASLTGDAATLGRLEPAVASLVASLPQQQQQEASHPQPQPQQHIEGRGKELLHRGREGLARLASGWHWPGAGAAPAAAAHSADHHSAGHGAAAHGKGHTDLPHWPFTHLFGASASTVTAGAAPTAAARGSAATASVPPAPAGVVGLPDPSVIPMRIGLVVPTQVCYVVKAAPAFAVQPARHAAWRLPHLPHMFPGAPAAGAPAAAGGPAAAGSHQNGSSGSSSSSGSSADGGRKFVSGAAEVVGHLLRTGYLWERVRVQGGAYGAFCSVNRSNGVLGFASYRDPNLAQTLEAYDGTGAHLRAAYGRGRGGHAGHGTSGSGSRTGAGEHAGNASDADPAAYPASGHPVPSRIVYHHGEGPAQGESAVAAAAPAAATAAETAAPTSAPAGMSEDVRKAILSTIGSLDAPQSPEERGDTSTARWLTGITTTDVQTRRAQVLGTGPSDIEEFAAAADRVAAEGRVVVVGSQAAFDAYHRAHRDQPMFALAHPLAKAGGARGAGAGGSGGAGARSGAASAAWAAAAAEAGRRSKQHLFVMPRPVFLPPPLK